MASERKLVKPSMEYDSQIQAYRQAFLATGETMHGASGLMRCENTKEWLEKLEQYRRPETVPEGRVIADEYLFVRETDRKVLGLINIRHSLNENNRLSGGHIGYSVAPDERRRGYATEMLGQGLKKCRELGLTRVLVTCNQNNEASRRTILKNGGVYENTVLDTFDNELVERYWIDLTKEET